MRPVSGAKQDPVFLVHTPAFEGPIELLASLAERAEVALETIPLADLTDAYLRALERDRPPLDRAAAFLVVAARLVQLKAARLFSEATRESEEELGSWEDAVRDRLQEYRRFKELAEALMQRHASGRFTFAGLLEPSVVPEARVQVSLDALAVACQQVLDRLPPAATLTVDLGEVSLSDKLEQLRAVVREGRAITFVTLFVRAATRLEAVITFLALLELIRIGEVTVHQASVFGEIQIRPRARGVRERG